jgi:hypothetical protein
VARALPILPGVVIVDVAVFQISATKVPKVVSDLVAFAQIAAGNSAYNDDDALFTSA